MEAEVTSKVKKVFDRKVTRLAIIGFAAVVVVGVLFLTHVIKIGSAGKNVVKQQTAKVMKGSLGITVTGSGSLISSNREVITPKVNGTLTKVYFKEGDSVKAGDLMFELDDTDASLNVEKIKNSISQTQLTQDTNVSNVSKLTMTAPFSGQVSNITVKSGDVLGKSASVLTITDLSKLKLLVPFNGVSIAGIKAGQQADVYIQSLMQSVEGKVTYVSDMSYSTASGGELYNVEIEVANPGSLKDNMKASAEIKTSAGTQASTDSGMLTYENNLVMKSDSGGTVRNVIVKDNQHVNGGDSLIELQNDDLIITKDTTDLKIQDLQTQLNSAQKQLTYCKIYSPIDGVIVKQSMKVGDVVKSGDIVSTVADAGHMQFDIPIDELDIAKVEVGQKVNVTIDALTETTARPLAGEVSKIAIEGTSSNGVTNYPVTIKVGGTDKLKGGMNANAEVIINQKTNALYLPIQAVQRMGGRSFVMVKGDPKSVAAARTQAGGTNAQQGTGGNAGGANRAAGGGNGGANRAGGNGGYGNGGAGGNNTNRAAGGANAAGAAGTYGGAAGGAGRANSYYANAIPKQIEVGINNDTDIEIISGLNAGDEVILPPVTSATQTQGQGNAAVRAAPMGGGGFGGGGGGFGGGRGG